MLYVYSFFFDVYGKILVYFIMLSLISFFMLFISRKILILFSQDKEKVSEYECGFEPFDNATRQPFDIHFYIVGLLFLIFDVEVALLFPWTLNIFDSSWIVFWSGFIFIIILIVGLVYEWHFGVLDWPY